MRKQQILQVLAVLGPVAVAAGGAPAVAQENRGTMEQQMACTPDVFRLCGAAIPDTNRIVACLRANTPQLSGPCRAVFETSDNAAANQPPQTSSQPLAPRRSYQYYQYQYQ
jgi:hypothetical protein